MPIKASYCNAFYDACKDDSFCGHGNFFECARVNPNATAAANVTSENREKYLEEEALLRNPPKATTTSTTTTVKYLQEEAPLRTQKNATAAITQITELDDDLSSAYVLGLAALALFS
jgi:hypothetical protein